MKIKHDDPDARLERIQRQMQRESEAYQRRERRQFYAIVALTLVAFWVGYLAGVWT